MANIDQAEGLRRMLATLKPRVLTVLSALSPDEKSTMLVNLGAALSQAGSKVLVVDANGSGNSVGSWFNARKDRSLLDVAKQQRTMQDAVKNVAAGLAVTMLADQDLGRDRLDVADARRLSRVFELAVHRSDVVLVDAELQGGENLPLAALDDSELVIQVSSDPDAIKFAYGMIKRLSAKLGRRSFGILVSGVTEKEANLIYTNMAQAASRYLAVPLTYVGYVPADEHFRKAAQMGRTVVDAFPACRAAMAFVRVSGYISAMTAREPHLEQLQGLGLGLGI